MEEYKKDIIMIYHIPVDGLTRQQAQTQIYEIRKELKTGDFYREIFLPKTYSGGKVDIEVINLKDNKTEHVEIKLEELNDRLMKLFEPDKWKRKIKLKKILK